MSIVSQTTPFCKTIFFFFFCIYAKLLINNEKCGEEKELLYGTSCKASIFIAQYIPSAIDFEMN